MGHGLVFGETVKRVEDRDVGGVRGGGGAFAGLFSFFLLGFFPLGLLICPLHLGGRREHVEALGVNEGHIS